ncbi:MAG: ATP-binding protein [Candidatus Zixiibacteriota bacterium]|nr:MAG: ATP-binding protein [candidate division Zixibacteria bacterium]
MKKPVITGDTIVIPSSTDYLCDVDIFIEGILRGYGADESIIADIAISVSELVINAISHGNKAVEDTSVKVQIGRNGKDVSITITDQGAGFNPEEIDDPLADENLLKEAGRGIFIVKSLMDNVEISPADGGTAITITKSLNN